MIKISIQGDDGEYREIGTTTEVNIDIEAGMRGVSGCDPFDIATLDLAGLERRVVALAGGTPGKTRAIATAAAMACVDPLLIPITRSGAFHGTMRSRSPQVQNIPRNPRQIVGRPQLAWMWVELVGILRRIDRELQAYTGKTPGKHLVQLVQQAAKDCDDWKMERELVAFIKGAYPLGSWAKAQRLIREYDEERSR